MVMFIKSFVSLSNYLFHFTVKLWDISASLNAVSSLLSGMSISLKFEWNYRQEFHEDAIKDTEISHVIFVVLILNMSESVSLQVRRICQCLSHISVKEAFTLLKQELGLRSFALILSFLLEQIFGGVYLLLWRWVLLKIQSENAVSISASVTARRASPEYSMYKCQTLDNAPFIKHAYITVK